MANNDDELFEEKTSYGPWNDKKEGNAWQQRWSAGDWRNTLDKVGGEWILKSLFKIKFFIEWDESKVQVYEAMTSNAKELTNLIKSLLTPDKEMQLKEIIKNKELLDKIKPFWGEFLNWRSMKNILNIDRKGKDEKKWINDEGANDYWKENIAQQDKTRCQRENEWKCS